MSHDRAFLERSVTSVLELDEHTHQATVYRGGWAAYLGERAVARGHAPSCDTGGIWLNGADCSTDRNSNASGRPRGVGRAKRGVDEPDQHVRQFRVASSERLAAQTRVNRTRR